MHHVCPERMTVKSIGPPSEKFYRHMRVLNFDVSMTVSIHVVLKKEINCTWGVLPC